MVYKYILTVIRKNQLQTYIQSGENDKNLDYTQRYPTSNLRISQFFLICKDYIKNNIVWFL